MQLMDRCDVSMGGGDSFPQTRRRARAEEKSLLAQVVIQNSLFQSCDNSLWSHDLSI